jgi:hypothetical protein
MKKQITKKSLMARINRKLEGEQQQLCKSQLNTRAQSNLDDFYVLDTLRHSIIDYHVDLAELARDIGTMANYEELTSE